MSRGPSGRIVVEIEPTVKQRLYAQLEGDNMTFKNWLVRCIEDYLGSPDFDSVSSSASTSDTPKESS